MKFEDMINTIQLGDCYELIKDIPDKSIDLVIIDPPYEYTTGGGGGCFGSKYKNHHKEYYKVATSLNDRKINNRNEIKHLSSGIDYSIFDELCRIMKYIYIYIWCSKSMVSTILKYFEEKDCNIDILTWHKTNPLPTMNNTYANDTEYCIFAREKGCKLYGNYESKKKYWITPINQHDKELYKHPTIKPLNIIKTLITNSTKENDIVLDCFCGSGTTCVACKETGRRFIGMEIDPEYHKIAVDRLNGINANGQTSIFTDFNNIGE